MEQSQIDEHKPRPRLHPLFLTVAIGWGVLMFIANNTSVQEWVEAHFASKVQFVIRERLNRTPPLDPRIKLLALDDSTFSLLGNKGIDPARLKQLLDNLQRRQPKAILFDFFFSSQPADTPENQEAIAALRRMKLPLYAGSFLVPRAIPSRYELSLLDETYHAEHYVTDPLRLEGQLPPMPDMRDHHVYGHVPAWEGVFAGKGHVNYEDVRRMPPFYRLRDTVIYPHLSVLAAESVRFADEKIFINNAEVPLTSDGYLYVNHRPPRLFYERAKSLRFALKRAEAGEIEKSIEPGDVVLVLLENFTGNTDIADDGPFGAIPGGFIIAAEIDGVISGRWLKSIEADNLILGVAILAGSLGGVFLSPLAFWIFSISTLVGYFLAVTYLFSWHAIVVPWALAMLGFAGAGLIPFAFRTVLAEIERLRLLNDFYAEKSRRLEEENKKIVLEQSLALGKVVQELLLPKKPSHVFGPFRFDTRYAAAQVMGGDWIYVWEVSENERRVFVGDVMGKGPSAAIPVAIIIGTLKDCENLGLSVEESIQRLNRRFVELFGAQVTATCAAIVLKASGDAEFYNAGSPGWFLAGPDKVEYLSLRSNPLGLSLEFKPGWQRRTLTPHMVTFTFTDGYLEGARALKRLMRELDKAPQPDSESLHAILLAAGEGSRLEDDRTLLAVSKAA